jgi:hypothetical protein
MDDNYTGNGSNNANGFQIDSYFLDMLTGVNDTPSTGRLDPRPRLSN